MKHSYRKIVAYNPTLNVVTHMKVLKPEQIFSKSYYSQSFREVYEAADTSREMIVGVGLARELYQLSPAAYGGYIKEDTETMKFIDRSRFFRAVDVYHMKNNIPFPDY